MEHHCKSQPVPATIAKILNTRNSSDVERLTKYWASGYDWRQHEAKLNALPHFQTNISVDGYDDISMHFIHQKSTVAGAIPLVFVHGWPGSFLEATRLLPLLAGPTTADGAAPSFHVVVPSLANFGFSSRVEAKGFAIAQHAEAVHKLMLALGYDEYVAQGGDWGWFVTRALGHLYPRSVKGIHTNFCNAAPPSPVWSPLHFATSMLKFVGQAPGFNSVVPQSWTYTKREMANMERAKDWFDGSGRGLKPPDAI